MRFPRSPGTGATTSPGITVRSAPESGTRERSGIHPRVQRRDRLEPGRCGSIRRRTLPPNATVGQGARPRHALL